MSESKPIIIALVIAGLGIIGYLAYTFMQDDPKSTVVSQPLEIPESKPIETPVPEKMAPELELEAPAIAEITPPEPTPEVVKEPEKPAFILPRLDDSDGLIRDGVVTLTRHEGINNWVRPGELVRKFVVLVDNAANGSVAKEAAIVLGPDQLSAPSKYQKKSILWMRLLTHGTTG